MDRPLVDVPVFVRLKSLALVLVSFIGQREITRSPGYKFTVLLSTEESMKDRIMETVDSMCPY